MMTLFWIGKALVGAVIIRASLKEAIKNKRNSDIKGYQWYLMLSIATLLFTGVDAIIIFELLREVLQ